MHTVFTEASVLMLMSCVDTPPIAYEPSHSYRAWASACYLLLCPAWLPHCFIHACIWPISFCCSPLIFMQRAFNS